MNIVILGATSAIAEAAARLWAARGDSLYLLARRAQLLEAIAADLRLRGAAKVGFARFDVQDSDAHAPALEQALQFLGTVDCVLVAHGNLLPQAACEADPDLAIRELDLNGVKAAAFVLRCASLLEVQGRGTLAVITSVAGVRGRASNAVYGSAKAMMSTLLSGQRQRLRAKGVAVVDIRPGLVDTPMTADFAKGPLWATPTGIAPDLVRAIDRGTAVAYLPWFWRPIMMVVRHIPEAIFVRLRF